MIKKAILFLLFVPLLLAFAETPISVFDLFNYATGDSAITFSPNLESFYLNPANATNFGKGTFKLFIPAVFVNEESWDLYRYYKDNKATFEKSDFDPLKDLKWSDIEYLLSKDPFVSLQTPLNFYILTKPDKWGIQTVFGLNTYVQLQTDINKGVVPVLTSKISGELIGDIVVPLSISKSLNLFNRQVSLGLTLKYIHREKIFVEKKLFPEFSTYHPLLYNGDGFGTDIGAIVVVNKNINVGFSILDVGYSPFSWTVTKLDDNDTKPLPTKIPHSFIKPNFNVGMTFFPEIKGLTKTIDNNFISISLNDIWGPKDNFLNHLKIGLGTRIAKVFNLFLGLNGGYPTAGFDIDLWVFHLSYAFYTKELGKFPGQIPDHRHYFSISFSGIRRITPHEVKYNKLVNKKLKKEQIIKKKDIVKASNNNTQSAKIKQNIQTKEIQKKLAEEQKLAEQKKLESEKKEQKLKEMQEEAKKELQKLENNQVKENTTNSVKKETKSQTIVEEEEEEVIPSSKVIEEKEIKIKKDPLQQLIDKLKYYHPIKLGANKIKIILGIKFRSGRTDLSPDAKLELQAIYNIIKDFKGKIYVNGYTDSTGSYGGNLKISKLRAESVRIYLIKRGIDPMIIIAKGFGPEDPIATNKTREGRAKNRRIELVFEKK